MELAQLVVYLSNSSRILILDLKPVGRRKFGGLNVEKGKRGKVLVLWVGAREDDAWICVN